MNGLGGGGQGEGGWLRRSVVIAAILWAGCGVKAPPRPPGAPDRPPPPGVFTAPAATTGPAATGAPVNPAPSPSAPCERGAGEETCR